MESTFTPQARLTLFQLLNLHKITSFPVVQMITAGEVASFVRPEVTTESEGQQTPLAGTLRGTGEVVLVLP